MHLCAGLQNIIMAPSATTNPEEAEEERDKLGALKVGVLRLVLQLCALKRAVKCVLSGWVC